MKLHNRIAQGALLGLPCLLLAAQGAVAQACAVSAKELLENGAEMVSPECRAIWRYKGAMYPAPLDLEKAGSTMYGLIEIR